MVYKTNRMPRTAAKRTSTSSSKRVYRKRTAPVKRYSVHGHGGYFDNVKKRWGQGGGKYKKAFSDIGSIAGNAAGIGGTLGSGLGGLFNQALYALTGFGDYKIKKNTLFESNSPPKVINKGKEFIVRHKEYIQDVYSAAGPANTPSVFALQSYQINPGVFSTFPWLNSISDKFEQYRIQGMAFEYKSLYSDAVVTQNGSIGAIMLATEYNAGAPSFTNKQQLENYEFAQSCKPSCSVLHPIECARGQNVLTELYVRNGPVPVAEDIKTYDFGKFQIASQGIPLGAAGAAVNLGELWMTYEIAFLKPKIPTDGSTYVDSGYGRADSTLSIGTAIFTTANPLPLLFGGAPLMRLKTSSNIPIVFIQNGFQIPLTSSPMNYYVTTTWWQVLGVDAGANWSSPAVALTNGTLIPGLPSQQDIPSIAIGASNCNGCRNELYISVPAATPSVQTCTVSFQTNGRFNATVNCVCSLTINAIPSNAN